MDTPTAAAAAAPEALPADPTPSTPEPEAGDKLVPVTEAIRYRKRAQQAERQLDQLKQQLDELGQHLKRSEASVSDLERRQRIDALLAEADAADLGAARLLTEAAIEQMEEPDIALAVADLRRHKPYLFRQTRRSAAAMGEAFPDDPAVLEAAEHAAATGHRRDLLRYLRLRRGT